MAISIIGEDKTIAKHISCRSCGAVLEYLPVDVRQRTGKDYGGGTWVRNYIDCPRCHEEVCISES